MDRSRTSQAAVALAPAAQHIQAALRQAARAALDAFAAASLSSSRQGRDPAVGAQFELGRQQVLLVVEFGRRLEAGMERHLLGPVDSTSGSNSDWSSLSLVDDEETERRVAIARVAAALGQVCEVPLRQLDALVGPLIGLQQLDPARNPLRPASVADALFRALGSVIERAPERQLIEAELGKQLGLPLAQAYLAICEDLQRAGIQALSTAYRAERSAGAPARTGSGPETLGPALASQGAGNTAATNGAAPAGATGNAQSRTDSGRTDSGRTFGQVDPQMMQLLRNLNAAVALPAAAFTDSGQGAAMLGQGLPNLIVQHRDALQQAANSSLDHLIIDVVGAMFDQILADPKVPPQMARQIARLQLPVLRAALGDPAFFSSRKHPVRRFVNRIASLGGAADDLDDVRGKRLVEQVATLVHDIIEGDFEQIELYESKLKSLEQFVAEQAKEEVQEQTGAATLLAEREIDLRQQQRYTQQLQAALAPLPAPPFLRDFLAQVWSQALLRAARSEGLDSERGKRMRLVARELFLSVQPKGAAEQRKRFIAALPGLMKHLNDGLNHIGWPENAKSEFFGHLLPAHAESLRGESLSTLDFNLLVKRVDAVFATALPDSAGASAAELATAGDELASAVINAEEAQRIGLVQERAVDWSAKVDIDLSAEPQHKPAELAMEGLPGLEAAEAPLGRQLADSVQVGYAYRMHLQDQWQKVKLNYVSPGRSFFAFTHGARGLGTVSMTYRMLLRLCDAGRLRVFENNYLLERATARARRQLAQISSRGG